MTTKQSIQQYDQMIFRDFRKEYFGDFYNVGYWDETTTHQEQACSGLVAYILAHIQYHPQHILDVGCGLGAVSNLLKEMWPSAHVTGMNNSEKQVNYAAATYPACQFKTMDATALDFPSNSLDLVVSVEAANHFNTRLDFLKEAYRVLKPNSALCMTDVCYHNETRYAPLYIFDVAQYNYIESITAYEEMLRGIGFTNIVIEDINSKSWQPWINNVCNYAEKRYREKTIDQAVYDGWVKNRQFLYDSAEYYLKVTAYK